MKTGLLLALGSARWESGLVAGLARADSGFAVVRRCPDLADLLAVAAVRNGAVALIATSVSRLDRSAVAYLHESGVLVVGLFDAENDAGGAHLIALGCDAVVAVGEDVTGAIDELANVVEQRLDRPRLVAVSQDCVAQGPGAGRIVAVWGPVGSPGRSSVALSLADESARAGVETLLIDADPTSPTLSALLGLCDDVPGLLVAVRRAGRAGFASTDLSQLTARIGHRLTLLAGVPSQHSGELRPAGLAAIWSAAAQLVPLTIIDVGSDLAANADGFVGRSGSVAVSALTAADAVIVVGSADPIGLARLVTGLPRLREVARGRDLRLVINRVRRGAVGPFPERAICEALAEHVSETPWLVPDDRPAFDEAVLAGRTIAEVAPNSLARRSLAEFCEALRADLLTSAFADDVSLGHRRLIPSLLRDVDTG